MAKQINMNMNVNMNATHVELSGTAYLDDKYFLFSPDYPVPGKLSSFRRHGIIQQMSDGTIDCVIQKAKRSKSVKIKKLRHGSLSATSDQAILLYLKVYKKEGINIAEALRQDAIEAIESL